MSSQQLHPVSVPLRPVVFQVRLALQAHLLFRMVVLSLEHRRRSTARPYVPRPAALFSLTAVLQLCTPIGPFRKDWQPLPSRKGSHMLGITTILPNLTDRICCLAAISSTQRMRRS